MKKVAYLWLVAWLVASFSSLAQLELKKDARVVLLGNGLGARMMQYSHFEVDMHRRYPQHQLFIRNTCDEGDTPGFRPHSARNNPWAFPGAEKFRTLEKGRDRWGSGHVGAGHYKSSDEWLKTLAPNVIVAFFGYNESFAGVAGLDSFTAELEGFVTHTLSTAYNGQAAPQLALVSPIAFQDLSQRFGTPAGEEQNANLALYAAAMEALAARHQLPFVNLFGPTQTWFAADPTPLTRDGALLTDAGYAKLVPLLVDQLFGKAPTGALTATESIREAVAEKNWLWQNYYKIPNGVHVYGRRHRPYGPQNYPAELKKLEEMLNARDQAIWATASGRSFDLAAADAKTSALPDFGKSNAKYLPLADAVASIRVPEGYAINLFASEQGFADLANPVQLAFDNKGRLWIATMPSYPHYKPGDPKPNDKLIILEDRDKDGKADKQTIFADGLHLPMGFEISHDGVYVSQGYSLVLLRDTDGDDKADVREIVMSGFDDHDTHHAISAFCADPSGAFYLGEGTFLHSNVETAYGPVRSSNGGFFRYDPQRRHLERSLRLSIPNPWGIAYDDWGQNFFADTSDPNVRWMLPGSIRVGYGNFAPLPKNLLSVRVRPTSGLEIVSSRHFPDAVQGDLLINNNIGFQGTKQHSLEDDGTGYKSQFRQDLTQSSDRNFRPVDMEFAPDGSLYLVDWHNARIGHMQHNARDPNRDHHHGRVYRVTYPSRPLVKPAEIAGASIPTLLANLTLPEYRSRYRSRRELRSRNADAVLAALKTWVAGLDTKAARYEHQLVEGLFVSWGLNRVAEDLLRQVLKAKDYRARAAAVRVLRYSGHHIADQSQLLAEAAADSHGRVRMEGIVAASWLDKRDGLAVLKAAADAAKTAVANPGADLRATRDAQGVLHFAAATLKPAKIDRITISAAGKQQILNLSEVEVISGGKNIAAEATLTQSSRYDDVYIAALLVDGDRDNFAHSGTETNPWFELRFAQPILVEDLRVVNRKGYESRFKTGQVVFSRGGKTVAIIKADPGSAVVSGMDATTSPVFQAAKAYLEGQALEVSNAPTFTTQLTGAAKAIFDKGAAVYSREGHCITCHQPDGKGLPAAQFPPLVGSKWVVGDPTRLIKLVQHGLMGPLEVAGVTFPGTVPMPPFKALSDGEMAAVLSFVRNTFGHSAPLIDPQTVKQVRQATADKVGLYQASDLLREHPLR
jgi:mono/diheme cytochrome c family protein/glucose/arabinose dehydrogenase/lysophospholipase L1-like esterase